MKKSRRLISVFFKEAAAMSVSICQGKPSNHLVDFSNLFTNMEPT